MDSHAFRNTCILKKAMTHKNGLRIPNSVVEYPQQALKSLNNATTRPAPLGQHSNQMRKRTLRLKYEGVCHPSHGTKPSTIEASLKLHVENVSTCCSGHMCVH